MTQRFCPYCRKAPSSDDKKIWPFCSLECKKRDLGKWASESYCVAGGSPLAEDSEELDDDAPDTDLLN